MLSTRSTADCLIGKKPIWRRRVADSIFQQSSGIRSGSRAIRGCHRDDASEAFADRDRQASKEDIAQIASVKCGKRPPPLKKSGRHRALTCMLSTALPGRLPLIPVVVVAVVVVTVMIVNVMIAVIIG